MNRNQFYKSNITRQLHQAKDLLIDTDQATVIRDKYPKAQYHFLVVPKEDIANVTVLTREHLPLLDHMKELANQAIESQQEVPSKNFIIGFKIDAFMNRLNMHVISDDFYSESMRRKAHWNSFNTDLFLTYQAVYALLQAMGSIKPIPAARAKEYRKAELLYCNQCNFNSKSLLALKAHLFEHWKKREVKLKIKQQVEKVTRMLDEAKLEDKPNKELDEASSPQPIERSNWQAKSPPKKQSNSATFEPNAKPANWRQNSRPPQPAELQPPAPCSNPFERHYQKAPYNQGGGAQYQPHQGNNNNFPGQQGQPKHPTPEFRQFNQQIPNGPRPHINGPNSAFNQQLRPNSNSQQNPNGQNPRFSQYRPSNPNGFTNNIRFPPIQHIKAQPHFNPFKQSPRMVQPYHEAMQNKPNFKHRPQLNQAQYMQKNLPVQHNQTMQNKQNPRAKFQPNLGRQNESKNTRNEHDKDQSQAQKSKENTF